MIQKTYGPKSHSKRRSQMTSTCYYSLLGKRCYLALYRTSQHTMDYHIASRQIRIFWMPLLPLMLPTTEYTLPGARNQNLSSVRKHTSMAVPGTSGYYVRTTSEIATVGTTIATSYRYRQYPWLESCWLAMSKVRQGSTTILNQDKLKLKESSSRKQSTTWLTNMIFIDQRKEETCGPLLIGGEALGSV